ncbi:hypothetical protein ACVMII_000798 [Bradyrhizobium diazoefficiens]
MANEPLDGWRRFVAEANTTSGFPPAPLTPTPPLSMGFSGPAQLDVLETLPPAAAERLRLLRQRAADAHAVCVPHSELQEAVTARISAENRLRELIGHPQEFGHGLPPTDARVVTQQRLVAKLTDDFRRLQERSETKAAAWRMASQALANVEDWLRIGRPHGTMLEAYDGPEPKLAKGENGLLDAVENRRRRVRELRADMHRIRSAPFPSSYAKAQMRAQVEALAQRGAPSVSRLVELDGPVDFQTQSLTSEVHAERRALAFTEAADALALVAWLHRDALITALDREIASEADDKAALSHEARQQQEAELMSDLLDIERQEAAFVWQAQSQGLPVEHRADISPLALLGLAIVTAPRADHLPGTSAGHSWDLWR